MWWWNGFLMCLYRWALLRWHRGSSFSPSVWHSCSLSGLGKLLPKLQQQRAAEPAVLLVSRKQPLCFSLFSLSTVLMICFDPLRRNFCVLTGRGLDRNCAAWIEKLPENAIDYNTLNDAPPMPYLDTQQLSLLTRVCGATKTVKQRKGHCYSTYASFKMFLTTTPPPLHAKWCHWYHKSSLYNTCIRDSRFSSLGTETPRLSG